MGLGSEWRGPDRDYEWVDLSAVDIEPLERHVGAVLDALRADPLWRDGPAVRVLLVDLDNLRVQPSLLRGRIAMAVALARQADRAGFAGQEGAVRRALPYLEEYAESAVAVGGDHNEADEALLDVAASVANDDVQFVVVSNDNIFARLARRGPLTVLSPGAASLSDELAGAADRVVDMPELEAAARRSAATAVSR